MAKSRGKKQHRLAAEPAPDLLKRIAAALPPRKARIVTRQELARLIDTTPDQITRLIAEDMPGVIETGGGRGKTTKIDLAQALPWLLGRKDERDARDRYYTARAEEVETKNRVRRGELIEAADVDRAWAAIVLAVRERILGLPVLLLQRGLIEPTAEAHVEGLVRDALLEFEARKDRADAA